MKAGEREKGGPGIVAADATATLAGTAALATAVGGGCGAAQIKEREDGGCCGEEGFGHGEVRAAAAGDTAGDAADICTAAATVNPSGGDEAAGGGGRIQGTTTAEATSTTVAAPRSRAREKGRAAGRGNNGIRGTATAAVAASRNFNAVDGSLREGHVEEEISTVRLQFSFCFTDKTMKGDGGERVTRRRIVRSTKGVGGRARVVGLGDEVQRRRRCCSLRSRLHEKEKIMFGLERSSGVSCLRTI